MKLTQKLIGHVYSAFDKSPNEFIAFRIRHTSSAFNWLVEERVFYGYDADSLLFSYDLNDYTIAELLDVVGATTGVSIVYSAPRSDLDISACSLIDGRGYIAVSNGDAVQAYTSTLWMYFDALATELLEAKNAISQMLAQMSVKTASGYWLDEWGGRFGVLRENGESDTVYANRIVVEVFRPRGNNKAIELALLEKFGQVATVENVTRYKSATNVHNSSFPYDGSRFHDGTADPIYGFFKVNIAYDLEGGTDLLAYAAAVSAFIENFKDVGTHMDSLALSAGALIDSVLMSDDAFSVLSLDMPLSDSTVAPDESISVMPVSVDAFSDACASSSEGGDFTVDQSTVFNGLRNYSGAVVYSSGVAYAESL